MSGLWKIPRQLLIVSRSVWTSLTRSDPLTPPWPCFRAKDGQAVAFIAFCDTRQGNPLQHRLVSQKNICLNDVMAALLQTDQGAPIAAKLESTNGVVALPVISQRAALT